MISGHIQPIPGKQLTDTVTYIHLYVTMVLLGTGSSQSCGAQWTALLSVRYERGVAFSGLRDRRGTPLPCHVSSETLLSSRCRGHWRPALEIDGGHSEREPISAVRDSDSQYGDPIRFLFLRPHSFFLMFLSFSSLINNVFARTSLSSLCFPT